MFSSFLTGLQQTVERQLFNFRRYDFLWKEDMHALYQVFVDNDPGTTMFKLEVERLQNIEHDVLEIPGQLMVGSVCLNTSPIKDSLYGFAVAWKMRYSTQLHEEAKVCCFIFVLISLQFSPTVTVLVRDLFILTIPTCDLNLFSWVHQQFHFCCFWQAPVIPSSVPVE